MRRFSSLLSIGLLIGLLYFSKPYWWIVGDVLSNRDMDVSDKIYTSLMEEQEQIFLVGYNLTEADLAQIWNDMMYSRGDLFFVNNQYEYTMFSDTIVSLTPSYKLTQSELVQARTQYDAAIQDILSQVKPDWTPLETALYLHDYLCMHYVYDESLTRYTSYQMLTDKLGVCQAYTLLYNDLLSACGIDSDYIISAEMDHTWNTVTIDGVPYHVDITYDDPTADTLGRALHKHFLVSDQVIGSNHSFTAEEGNGTYTDTTYDHAFWREASSGFIPLDNYFYYIKQNTIYRWRQHQTPKAVFTIPDVWFTDSTQTRYWDGCFSVLWSDGKKLLYNTPTDIMALDPKTGTTRSIYHYTGNGSIFGFVYEPDKLLLQVSSSPNEHGEYIAVTGFHP